MVVTKLTKYLHVQDRNKCVVGSWAVESGQPGIVKCKFCDNPVQFKSGQKALTNHSETTKHQDNVKKAKHSSSKQQLNIDDSLRNSQKRNAEDTALEDKAKTFEIALARSLSHHKIVSNSSLVSRII